MKFARSRCIRCEHRRCTRRPPRRSRARLALRSSRLDRCLNRDRSGRRIGEKQSGHGYRESLSRRDTDVNSGERAHGYTKRTKCETKNGETCPATNFRRLPGLGCLQPDIQFRKLYKANDAICARVERICMVLDASSSAAGALKNRRESGRSLGSSSKSVRDRKFDRRGLIDFTMPCGLFAVAFVSFASDASARFREDPFRCVRAQPTCFTLSLPWTESGKDVYLLLCLNGLTLLPYVI